MEERLKKTIARRVKNGCVASLAAEVIMPSGTVRVVTRACAVDGGLLPPSGGPKIAKGAVEPSVLVRSGRAGTAQFGMRNNSGGWGKTSDIQDHGEQPVDNYRIYFSFNSNIVWCLQTSSGFEVLEGSSRLVGVGSLRLPEGRRWTTGLLELAKAGSFSLIWVCRSNSKVRTASDPSRARWRLAFILSQTEAGLYRFCISRRN